MNHPVTFVPSDAAIADLKLLLRGVRLPVDVLGGNVVRHDHATVVPGTTRLHAPAELAERIRADRAVVVADEESKPIATIAAATVSAVGEREAIVAGRIEPVDPGGWEPLTAATDDRPVSVVVAARPFLPPDLDRLRTLSDDTDVVVAVPMASPSPDRLPAATLLRLIRSALADGVAGRPVHVVPVELAWRAPEPDAALARAVALALGAATVTPMPDGDQDWATLLAALDRDEPLPPVADGPVLRELRRWRAPRSRRGVVLLLTGLSGSGKSTLARALAEHVRTTTDRTVSLLDGDLVRRLLSSGLGFDHASRDLNVRRIGFVAAEAARHGGIAIAAPIAPYAESRAAVRAMAEEVGDFVLVHVSTPLAECERRDVKGLYARARAGLIEQFTAISDPYDEPTDPDLVVDTSALPLDEALGRLTGFLEQHGWLPSPTREG